MASIDLKDLSEQQKQLLTGLLCQLTDPAARAKARNPRKPQTVRYWTEDEWPRFLKLIVHPMHRAAFVVAYHRGLRATETRKLMLSDVRLKDDRVQMNRRKGSASGEYHWGSTESRAVKAWLKVRGMRSEERRVGKECRSRWSP